MDLPDKSYFCSCDEFYGKILISGFHHEKLYIYDRFSDNYTQPNILLVSKYSKLIFKHQRRAYIINLCCYV